MLPDFGAGADRTVLPERPAAVASLSPIGNVPDTNVLTLALGLPLRDPAGLDDLIGQIYNPNSTNFHRFLTPPELAERFGPTPADYLAVRQFAESNGLAVAATYSNRMVLDVTGTARDISRAFQIKLYRYHHPVEPRDFYAPDTDPSVPVGLKINSVEGLTDFNRPKPAGRKVSASVARPLSFSGTGPNHEYMGYDFRNAYVPGTALT
ncbi:MAG TPA: protease pro-enzyme activation domain-containing protein, partial [Verrucomicrobiae bacterium]